MNINNLSKKISILIVLYQEDFNLIFRNLEKLKSFKVIIVDNANNEKLRDLIDKNFNIYKYCLNKKNLGFAKGYNQAIRLCDTEYALMLGPDCYISEDSILNLYTQHINNKDCFITAPTAYDENSSLTYNGGFLPENGDKDTPLQLNGNVCVQSVQGAAMFFKKEDILSIGLLDENFFLYFSDEDLCRRIKSKKKSVIQVFDSRCIHSHGKIKIKNLYKKIFVREYNFLFDELYYFLKINCFYERLKIVEKKIYKYFIKMFFCIFFFNFKKATFFFARILGYIKFKIFLIKSKYRIK